ncbi:MAG TPA: hypothetical protein VEV38_03000 [Candidatus Eremiobacteraceae bacterium]|nr:hypothetical protein [Candidatus Eremiobacteraceae bacterium]
MIVIAAGIVGAGCSSASTSNAVPIERSQDVGASPVPEIVVSESLPHEGKVVVFQQSDNGDVAPVSEIDGSGAGAVVFYGVAIAPGGDIIVTAPNDNELIAYADSATGPAAPLYTITCAGLNFPTSLAFDRRGNLYATNSGRAPFSISVMAATASGCVSTYEQIAGGHTGLFNPQGIHAAPAGRLYVLNNKDSVTEYAPGSSGNIGWTHNIHGPDTELNTNSECGDAIFVTPDGTIYVANAAGRSITEYAFDANGDVAPIRAIAGPMTGLHYPTAITVNDAGEIFVANALGNSITVYAAGAHGDAPPIQTIAGPNTQLSGFLEGIALDN